MTSEFFDAIVEEASKHARTQTRYRGPDRLTTWHCACGYSGESTGRIRAILDHQDHIKSELRKLLR